MEALINLGYMVAVILLTTFVLTYIVKNTKLKKTNDKRRMVTTLICGLVLAPVWYLFLEANLGQLIISLLAAMQGYRMVKLFTGIDLSRLYDNGKGVV